jgi:hypothetical protein
MAVILRMNGCGALNWVLGFLRDNLSLVLTGVFALLAVILTQQRLTWWQWFHEVAFFAWDAAEKRGLLEGIKGEDKLRHYLEVYRTQYGKKWGEQPTERHLAKAAERAAELSAKEKVIRLADPMY